MNRKDDKMGAVYVTAKLSNAGDIELADRGLIGKEEIRTWTGEALVDTESSSGDRDSRGRQSYLVRGLAWSTV
jgi:hypothetical protein